MQRTKQVTKGLGAIFVVGPGTAVSLIATRGLSAWNQTYDPITPSFEQSLFHAAQIVVRVIGHSILPLLVFSAPIALAVHILYVRRRRHNEAATDQVFLELRFPRGSTASLSQIFDLFYSLAEDASDDHKISHTFALEVVGTKTAGYRYIVRCPYQVSAAVSRALVAQVPGLKVSPATDWIHSEQVESAVVCELTSAQDALLPLELTSSDETLDPFISALTQMADQELEEVSAIQFSIGPITARTRTSLARRIVKLRQHAASGTAIAPLLRARRDAVSEFILALTDFTQWLLLGIIKSLFGWPQLLPETPLGAIKTADASLERAIARKLDQPLFQVRVRIMADASSRARAHGRLRSIVAALRTWRGQANSLRQITPDTKSRRLSSWSRFRKRAVEDGEGEGIILTDGELAALYHFPSEAQQGGLAGLNYAGSPYIAPPPWMMESPSALDVFAGTSPRSVQTTIVGMTLDQRRRHTYVLGKTGSGKTTLLQSAIYQDMTHGHGMAVLDPHGDMFEALLSMVPQERINDVIVLDPADREWPVGLNLLQPGINFTSNDERLDRITSAVVMVMKQIAGEYWGKRMEHILRYATLTALSLPDPNLHTLYRLIADEKYRKRVARALPDPVLRHFWLSEIDSFQRGQIAEVMAPLTQRLGQFKAEFISRNILMQQDTTVSLQRAMDEGKILLVNLSKGQLGADVSTFFGTIITSLIWMSAQQRAHLSLEERRDFFVYVDEFQNFAVQPFTEIIAEGRKYRVNLTISHQSSAQIPDRNQLELLMGGVNNIVAFGVGPTDEHILLPHFMPALAIGDISGLGNGNFYLKTGPGSQVCSGETIALSGFGANPVRQLIIDASRSVYAKPKAEVERVLEGLWDAPPELRAFVVDATRRPTKDEANGSINSAPVGEELAPRLGPMGGAKFSAVFRSEPSKSVILPLTDSEAGNGQNYTQVPTSKPSQTSHHERNNQNSKQ